MPFELIKQSELKSLYLELVVLEILNTLTIGFHLKNIQAINSKIVSLNYGEFRAEIKSVDAQESLNSGVHVLVTGFLTGKDNVTRNFAQSFFLAPQERGGYFVLNDIFRYVENATSHDENKDPASDVEAIRTPEQGYKQF